MIPIRDANPTQRVPYVTLALIALNVAAFFFWQPLGSAADQPTDVFAGATRLTEGELFTFCHGAIPAELTSLEPLEGVDVACGGKLVLGSLFTAMFLHGGLIHLGGNMLFLWVFGNNVEDRMGRAWFLLFYLAAGVAATYGQVLRDVGSPIPLIGASGAIAGILGAYLVMFPRARVLTLVIFFFFTLVELPAVAVLGFWFIIQAFQGVGSLGAGAQGGVAWFAHIGGFLFGLAVAWIFYRRPRQPRPAPPGIPY